MSLEPLLILYKVELSTRSPLFDFNNDLDVRHVQYVIGSPDVFLHWNTLKQQPPALTIGLKDFFRLGLCYDDGLPIQKDSSVSLIMRALVLCVLISSMAAIAAENETLTELQHRAEQSDVKAQAELCAKYTVTGDAEPPDVTTVVKWCGNAADNGYADGQFGLGVMIFLGQGVAQDNAEAVKWYRRAAEQGHVRAQATLGMMHVVGGAGLPQDYAEALKWALRAAEQNDRVGQLGLSVMYANSWGVTQDDAEAEKWLLKSLEDHDPEERTLAEFNTGDMYAEGKNVPQNDNIAAKWYHRAAERDHTDAQFKLGVMYEQGKGVPKNNFEAMNWYLASAEQGHAQAEERLRAVHATEKAFLTGTRAYEQDDFAAALEAWHPLAEQGDARAQTSLAHIYADGKGVPQNDAEAVKWYRKAAEQGYAKAQAGLGAMYAYGRGVPQDNMEAYAWLNIAVAQGFAPATEGRDFVAQRMTYEARESVQRLAQQYWEAYVLPFRD